MFFSRKCTIFLFYLSSHYHIYIFKSLCTSTDDEFENLGETNVLTCKMFTSGCRPWLKNVACLSSLVLPWCVHVVCILIQNFWLFQIITNFVYYVVIEVRLEVRLAPFPHEYHCNAPNDIGNNMFLYTTQVNNAQWLASTAVNSHYFTIHS